MGQLFTEYEHIERTVDQDRSARLYVAEVSIAGGWSGELPEVLAMLGLA